MATLTVVAVNDPYLSVSYLDYAIACLNQQDSPDFNVIWINQCPENQSLTAALSQANFEWFIYQPQFPFVGPVCCWEVPMTLHRILQHPETGTYLTYLHKECCPAPDFVSSLLHGIHQAETALGQDNIYILNQLRSPLTLADMNQANWYDKLQQTPAKAWSQRNVFQRPTYTWREERWLEDVFCIPVHLVQRLNLFGCVTLPLFFQDVFDLMLQISERPYAQFIRWVRLGGGVIYHLNHPRCFYELSQLFFQQVRHQSALFSHLALYEFAQSDFDYQEPFVDGERQVDFKINQAVRYLQYSERGTMTLWMRALDQWNGFSAAL